MHLICFSGWQRKRAPSFLFFAVLFLSSICSLTSSSGLLLRTPATPKGLDFRAFPGLALESRIRGSVCLSVWEDPQFPACSRNQGSSSLAPVFVAIEYSWADGISGTRGSCRIWFFSRSSYARVNPSLPATVSNSPSFLVAVGQATRCLCRGAPSGPISFNDWWLFEDLVWRASMDSAFRGIDEHSRAIAK